MRTVLDMVEAVVQPDSLRKHCCTQVAPELADTDSSASHMRTVPQRSVELELELGRLVRPAFAY